MPYQSPTPYPYLPEGRSFQYVPLDNPFMLAAKQIALESNCLINKTGAVMVKNGKIIAEARNGGKIKIDICPRIERNIPTGQGYELCHDVCQQDGHAEAEVSKKTMKQNLESNGADIYFYGHWWCCKNCWDKMIKAGVNNVYLPEGATEMFEVKRKPNT